MDFPVKVTETTSHKALANMLEIRNHRKETFPNRVRKYKDSRIPGQRQRNTPKTLATLNHHRNIVSHAQSIRDSELLTRSLIYLLNTALVWKDIASEPVDDDPE